MKREADTPPNGFKPTEIGLIPEEWDVLTIKEFGDVITGTTPSTSKSEFYGGPFMLISPADLGNHMYVTDSQRKLTEAGLAKSRVLPKNSVLITCIGSVGKTGITGVERSACNQQINAVICNHETDARFFYFLVTHIAPDIEARAVKTTLPILNKSNFEQVPVFRPPLPEQRAIAHVLSKIQAAVQAQAAIAGRARELKRALMAKLFTEGLRGEPLKETEIGVMPEGWDVVELGQIAEIVYGAQAAVAHATDPSIGTPIFTNINIANEGYLDLGTLRYYKVPEGKRDRLILKRGDVLFNWRSGSQEHVGKTALFDLDGEYTFSSFILRFRTMERVSKVFLLCYLQYIKSQGFFARNRQQSSVNSVFNASVAAKIPVPLPALDEQRTIAHTLQTVDAKIAAAERKRAGLEELFRAMLGELMTGRVRVKS